MNKVASIFLGEAIAEMIASDISILMPAKKRVICEGDGIASNGYFLERAKKFACAAGKPTKQWLPVFTHEWNHYRQWKEGSEVFKAVSAQEELRFFNWLTLKVEMPVDQVRVLAQKLQAIEYDCELRTLATIKNRGLDKIIDVDTYARNASSYVMFYSVITELRKWYVVAPYEVLKITNRLGNKLWSPSDPLPKWYIGAVKEYCF